MKSDATPRGPYKSVTRTMSEAERARWFHNAPGAFGASPSERAYVNAGHLGGMGRDEALRERKPNATWYKQGSFYGGQGKGLR